jgi:hypothetical protein
LPTGGMCAERRIRSEYTRNCKISSVHLKFVRLGEFNASSTLGAVADSGGVQASRAAKDRRRLAASKYRFQTSTTRSALCSIYVTPAY